MRLNVLIVERDIAIAEEIARLLEQHESAPHCDFVSTGFAAMEYLKKNAAFLIITELVLSDMDAFGLLDFVRLHAPEIPVMVLTGDVKPRTREVLVKKGVADFLVKPLQEDNFLNVLTRLYEKIQNGGTLTSVTLDAFAQMVEMEQRTCILRVFHMENDQCGVLFFRNGEVVHARVMGAESGMIAARKIFSWQSVSLMIENAPVIQRHTIHAGLQALLMESMRFKDEAEAKSAMAGSHDKAGKESQGYPETLEEWLEDLPFDAFCMQGAVPGYNGETICHYAEKFCEILGAGELLAVNFCTDDGIRFLVSPQKRDVSIMLPPFSDREKLLRLLEYQVIQS